MESAQYKNQIVINYYFTTSFSENVVMAKTSYQMLEV